MRTALVLAGGGVAGIAWELGVLRGLADADPGLAARIIAADLVVGTSAGSAVAAQITSGTPLDDLYQAQLAAETAEIEPAGDLMVMLSGLTRAVADGGAPDELRRRIGALAAAADTVDPAARLASITARLPRDSWPTSPEQKLVLTAVDIDSGEGVVFHRTSGVPLADAVAASCAVPCIWPVVTIDGRRYMDGGLREGTNLDLAAGYDRILLIMPQLADAPALWGPELPEQVAALEPSSVYVVSADQPSLDAFGANPLSPATRAPSAEAGRAIGRANAAAVAAFWP
ncbi:patatin-like phospholipase family protein [Actinoplanes couchii]|uniref:PNPLA domain-containing protein n=1 Tax=Actinoplanes couchii TaxID=403638 RepID=A0ABQ3XL62_9ACTN|nr:patatin-like phospholipase family protein [Actinoplanes couchii]MDR6318413.1 NTE family protein [Actinoplanes couchii]GID59221.1 hypothetical protein Aco03nite_076250 [Actinoplanes couchii]